MKDNFKLSLTDLLQAGVHLGHKTNRWNPLMKEYIYGSKGGIHIIDIRKTLTVMQKAANRLFTAAKKNERILFVGTKPSASSLVEEFAEKTAQYYIAKKWQGGTLTNFKTTKKSIREVATLSDAIEKGNFTYKKEEIVAKKKLAKKKGPIEGILNMEGLPHVMIVFDVNVENKAIKEANKLGIFVIAIVDTNASPEGVDLVIPGNDDNAIGFYLEFFANAILSGLSKAFDSNIEISEGDFDSKATEEDSEKAVKP